ncbi:hypothetical protein M7I_3124 [Glarea lozoyensis 74030]|uniref:Uncharacterized protein n=1 Tax=Glarea lozoyensis (strain ATCC 74030 / MF5533) TaxID=1104152 RepID=H0EKM5_GLAL7|nr:hypothetical protein M7I_3124 [Glarea lozoyensis 74030]
MVKDEIQQIKSMTPRFSVREIKFGISQTEETNLPLTPVVATTSISATNTTVTTTTASTPQ